MRIERRYTKAGQSPYADIAFRLTTSEIRNPDGSVVFRQEGIEVPESWSQVACDVLAQKYFRKAGIPAKLKRVEEYDVPSFLWRSVPDSAAIEKLPEGERSVSEHDSRQVFDRLAEVGERPVKEVVAALDQAQRSLWQARFSALTFVSKQLPEAKARVLKALDTIQDSLKLGRAVLGEIGSINTLHKASVEQAGFAVLKAPDIPSILVETAFISNPEEERRLGDTAYQDKMARAILSGIRQYFAKNPPLARSRLAMNP